MKLVFLLPSFLVSIFCFAQTQTGSIRGTLTNKSGAPIAYANVSVAKTSYHTVTDLQGNFAFERIEAGVYTMLFSSVTLEPFNRLVEVMAGATQVLTIETDERVTVLEQVNITGVKTITGMGYMDEVHAGAIYAGKKTEVLILDSLDANMAQNNPREVLGRVPGANYSETEGSGFPSNGIGFRGLNPTQSIETNTRQNGYNITADLFGYPESYYLPPLEGVARIEVTRGASSLQYGAQFGGVINYIMRKGNTNKPLELTTQQTGGSFGMFNSFNAIGGQIGKFNYYTFAQFQTSNGWRPNSDFRKFTGFARVGYKVSDKITVGLEYSLLRNYIHMPGGLSDSLFDINSRTSFRARNWIKSPWNILTATLEWKVSASTSLYVKSSLNSSARNLVWLNEDVLAGQPDPIDPITQQYTNREVEHEGFASNTTEVRLLSNYELGNRKSSLAAGVRYYHGAMKRQEGGPGTNGSDFDLTLTGPYEKDYDFTTTNIAPFVENVFRFGNSWSVTPGLRYEYIRSTVKGYGPNETEDGAVYSDDAKSRSFLLAGLGIQFQTTATTNIYANWSQAYRPLDYSSLVPIGTIVSVDKNLKDSKGYNADIGFRGWVKNFLNFDVGAFYLSCNNRVGVVEISDSLGNQHPFRTNVANSIHQGLESYVEINPIKMLMPTSGWSISFFNSLALVNARYSSGEFSGKFVEYAPTRIERFGTSFAAGKFSTTFLISSTARSFGDASNQTTPSADAVAGVIPAYTVMDWSGTVRISNFNLKFGCNNLADHRYFTLRTGEYPGPGIIPAIGRSFYIGIGARF